MNKTFCSSIPSYLFSSNIQLYFPFGRRRLRRRRRPPRQRSSPTARVTTAAAILVHAQHTTSVPQPINTVQKDTRNNFLSPPPFPHRRLLFKLYVHNLFPYKRVVDSRPFSKKSLHRRLNARFNFNLLDVK